jgi:hypothetical protein
MAQMRQLQARTRGDARRSSLLRDALAALAFSGLLWLLLAGVVSAQQPEPAVIEFGAELAESGLVVAAETGAAARVLDTGLSLHVSPLLDADGDQTALGAQFASRFLTPTGFPIEREGAVAPFVAGAPVRLDWDGSQYVGQFRIEGSLPSELPDGTYALVLRLHTNSSEFAALARTLDGNQSNALMHARGVTAAVVTVGSVEPPRLTPVLLMDHPDQAAGAVRLLRSLTGATTKRFAAGSRVDRAGLAI